MAKYSLGSDYHFVIKEKLKPLMALISEQFPAVKMRVFTDSAPVFDKSWAIKAGLGWMGKNTLLLNKNLGSFFVIGEILLDIELQPDTPLEKEYCGNCTRCIDACPTQALIAPYQMDARRCISYLTIESKTAIPEEFHSLLNDWIFGCDICQDVCPWNNRAKPHNEPAFDLSADLLLMKKEDWENLEKPDFKRLFKSSPQMRSGYERFKMLIDLQKD
jgi:epoxyqueuosine reductase